MTKLQLRRAWFQVHKWIGLILAIVIVPLSVTGSALVWDEALDHGLNPQRYAVSGGAPTAAQAYVEAASAARASAGAAWRWPFPASPASGCGGRRSANGSAACAGGGTVTSTPTSIT